MVISYPNSAKDVTILFTVNPQRVLENIEMGFANVDKQYSASYDWIGKKLYSHMYNVEKTSATFSEAYIRHDYLSKQLNDKGCFSIINEFAKDKLKDFGEDPRIIIDKVLEWNQVALCLGQDILITAYYAYNDYNKGACRLKTSSFGWPVIIRTDDTFLNGIIENGLSENHFHLNGSTQMAHVSWTLLMNFPSKIAELLSNKEMKDNLIEKKVLYKGDNSGALIDYVKLAALIRGILFDVNIGCGNKDEAIRKFRKYNRLPSVTQIAALVDSLRSDSNVKIKQKNGCSKCLDYAMTLNLYNVNANSDVRLLSSERAFLYSCFYNSVSGFYNEFLNNMFYLYLLIKEQFRGEMIQKNDVKGFENFSLYQDRKDKIYENAYEYLAEAMKIAVSANIKMEHVSCLEARIMSKNTPKDIATKVIGNDRMVGADVKDKFFYVIHFPKEPISLKDLKNGFNHVRNNKTREKARRGARALVNLKHSGAKNVADRILGIDACSSEIGCRPETFATDYRYIKNEIKGIGITYHVGEDFLDLCDGLRAVDEAVRFLELGSGDRIGHGIALGVDPNEYYKDKHCSICLAKQDALDNSVWMLFRSLELQVEMSEFCRERLKRFAIDLLHDLYGKYISNTDLYVYYDSYKIRGDNPMLYKSGKYESKKCLSDYERAWISEDNELQQIRLNASVGKLYYAYHYDEDIIRRSLDAIYIKVEPCIVELIGKMQDAMLRLIQDKRIAIECNPTSNMLIGAFHGYENHPITRFNSNYLTDDGQYEIMVSINTDDMGVFNTSLENEYAVMFAALYKKAQKRGGCSKESIYNYLRYVRDMGVNMSFRNKKGNICDEG